MGTKSTTTTKLPAFQEQFLSGTVFPFAKQIASTPYEQYTGQRVAEMTPLQSQAMSGYGALSMGTPLYTEAADLYRSAGAAITPEDIARYQSTYTTDVIDASMRDIGRQQEAALNQLGATAGRAGAFGGSRHGISEAETRRAYGETAADTAARLREAGYTQALSAAAAEKARQSGAAQGLVGTAGSTLEAQLAGLGAQMAAGEVARGLSQAELDAMYQDYIMRTQYPLTQLGALTSASGAVPGGIGTTTQTTGGLGPALGAVGSIGKGLISSGLLKFATPLLTLSDVRLKKNLFWANQMEEVNFYTWDWNEEAERLNAAGIVTYGVIAQELEETRPHLVEIGEDGYRRVNYAGLMKELGAL